MGIGDELEKRDCGSRVDPNICLHVYYKIFFKTCTCKVITRVNIQGSQYINGE